MRSGRLEEYLYATSHEQPPLLISVNVCSGNWDPNESKNDPVILNLEIQSMKKD